MSASVNGDSISLTRGDSLILNVQITRNGDVYEPAEGDVIRFALSRDTKGTSEPIILKNIDPTAMRLVLNPEDTKTLDYGTYVYDIELRTKEGFVDTFIGPAKFKITEEVY